MNFKETLSLIYHETPEKNEKLETLRLMSKRLLETSFEKYGSCTFSSDKTAWGIPFDHIDFVAEELEKEGLTVEVKEYFKDDYINIGESILVKSIYLSWY